MSDLTAAQEWLTEATEVLELVGDFPDTGSAEDREFRKRAPYFMREALDALEAVLALWPDDDPCPPRTCVHTYCEVINTITAALGIGGGGSRDE